MYLHGTITEQVSGKIYDVNSAVFNLPVGVTVFSTENYTVLTPEQVLFKSLQYEDYLTRTNELPRGEYTFCIELLPAGQQNVLANSCLDFSVQTTTPPALISPVYADTLCDPNPFFIWTPPQPPLSGSDVSYQLQIVELQGSQNPVSATLSNPVWYRAENLSSPVFQYGLDGRPFVSGRQYAWWVLAIEGKKEQSRSDISYFVWRSCDAATGSNTSSAPEKAKQNKQRKGVQYFLMPEFDNDEIVTVTDKLLNISYINPSGKKALLRIETPDGKAVIGRDLELNPGYNFFSLSPAEWKFSAGQRYSVVLMNESGKTQRLHFWYKPAN